MDRRAPCIKWQLKMAHVLCTLAARREKKKKSHAVDILSVELQEVSHILASVWAKADQNSPISMR